MTEDFDKDLEGLAGDLDNLDLGDISAGEDAPAAAAEEGGGESVELDDDLQAMLDSSGEGEEGEADAGEDILGGGEPEASSEPAAPARAAAAPAPAPQPPPLPTAGLSGDQVVNLEFLLDIKLHVTFEVGRSKMLISDLLTLGQGSVIELHRLVGDELDLLINGKLIAKGEVVVVNEKFGCKITDIIPPEDRVKHLGTV
ncbi:MAG TPA: flagellar motor switch protein FliN [bacterium]|nr:flagellar motor switch protein FliN [bacterium]